MPENAACSKLTRRTRSLQELRLLGYWTTSINSKPIITYRPTESLILNYGNLSYRPSDDLFIFTGTIINE